MDEFMRNLPERIATLLNPSQRIFHPELSELVSKVLSKAAKIHDGLLSADTYVNAIKTSSSKKAMELLCAWVDRLPDGEYILVAGGGNGTRFNDETFWVSHLPGHIVLLAESNSEIKELIASNFEECVLAALDQKAAIACETVGGYLVEEPSEREIVFELTSWGLHG
jgi:hypothetical protein